MKDQNVEEKTQDNKKTGKDRACGIEQPMQGGRKRYGLGCLQGATHIICMQIISAPFGSRQGAIVNLTQAGRCGTV